MKTDEFISLLSTGITPVDPHVQRRSLSLALVLGAIGAILLTLIVFGMRPDIREMLVNPLFWFKISFPFTLAIASLLLLIPLSRPGTRNISARLWLAPSGPILVIWIAALASLALAPQTERMNLIMGFSWRTCPFNIAFLSIPLCVTITWAVRQLAPTRLRAAGAVAGLLAGSVATMAYCLHCPEMGIPFWGIWYLIGMLIPAVLGAIFGPALLRW